MWTRRHHLFIVEFRPDLAIIETPSINNFIIFMGVSLAICVGETLLKSLLKLKRLSSLIVNC